jgi:hypothetical protein
MYPITVITFVECALWDLAVDATVNLARIFGVTQTAEPIFLVPSKILLAS